MGRAPLAEADPEERAVQRGRQEVPQRRQGAVHDQLQLGGSVHRHPGHRGSPHRSDWPGELSAHGPGEDGLESVRTAVGPVQRGGDHDQKDIPHADRWRALDAGSFHGECTAL